MSALREYQNLPDRLRTPAHLRHQENALQALRARGPVELCCLCGGPVTRHPREPLILFHDNATGWYAGRQMDHDAEVAS